MQTCIIMNCDAITMATCMLVEGDTTVVRLGKTIYISCHGITATSALCTNVAVVADPRTAKYKLHYSAALN